MTEWEAIDFHGIVTLNKSIIGQLTEYLEHKEADLAETILHTFHSGQSNELTPSLTFPASQAKTLLQGIDTLSARVQEMEEAPPSVKLPPKEFQAFIGRINQGLWNYVELLEGMVTEFFQQVDQIGFERWGSELTEVVDLIRITLQAKLTNLLLGLDKLRVLLAKYRSLSEEKVGIFVKIRRLASPHLIDKSLKTNIQKTEKFLGFKYQTFLHRIDQYQLLTQSTDHSIKKFDNYLVFETFEKKQKEVFLQLYRWIRIWELNQTTKSLPTWEPVRAIRSLQAPEKIYLFFKDYEKTLREALFSRSRIIKLQPYPLTDLVRKIQHQHALQGQIAELHTLETMVRKYRDFLLKSDPNPYIRSRLGFGEWIVGPEPAMSKDLMNLIYRLEGLDALFLQLIKAFEDLSQSGAEYEESKNTIRQTLHEMAQPLASYDLMKVKVKVLVENLARINELGCMRSEVVEFVRESLSKGLRTDWKFHVLHEIPQFHEIYAVHEGIVGSIDDRIHSRRMQRFKKLIQEIQSWVKNNDIHRHVDEIEFAISDLKVYLQDFLGHVQRTAKDVEDPAKRAMETCNLLNQLLECRYLFGSFFHHLRRDKAEERGLRNQFLFVDQYFETIENKLVEMRV